MTRANILVFRIGQLGDTVIALPAFWVVREYFKNDTLTLLTDVQYGKKYVAARDMLEGAGLFDEFLTYEFDAASGLRRLGSLARLLMRLRKQRFDTLVYLYPSGRSKADMERHRSFFKLAGIKNFIGMDCTLEWPVKISGKPLDAMPHESDLLLSRLAKSGLPVPPPGMGRMDLQFTAKERDAVQHWLSQKSSDGGRPWLGVAVSSKMPCKIWPEERFLEVVKRLINRFDFWPVIFGGPEDAAQAARLISAWQSGYNTAGEMSLRESACAMSRCKIFLGTDSGNIHLAAASNVPCVGVYASRNHPGLFFPYRVPQRILYTRIDCEGCNLIECIDRRMECILSITVDEVEAACVELLATLPEQLTR